MPTKRDTKLIARALVAYWSSASINYTEALRIVRAAKSLLLRDDATGYTYIATLIDPNDGHASVESWNNAAFITSSVPGLQPEMYMLGEICADTRRRPVMPPALMDRLHAHAREQWGVHQWMVDRADAATVDLFSEDSASVTLQRVSSTHVILYSFEFVDQTITESYAARTAQWDAREQIAFELIEAHQPDAPYSARWINSGVSIPRGIDDPTLIRFILDSNCGETNWLTEEWSGNGELSRLREEDIITVVRYIDLRPAPEHYETNPRLHPRDEAGVSSAH